MASGGLAPSSDGTRLLDATGKQILDDSCVRCCCFGQRWKVVVAGVTICSCPIPNQMPACGNNVCDQNFNQFGCLGPLNGDLLCAYNITGTVNGTYYLSGPGGGFVTSCTYQANVHPSPVQITVNSLDPVTNQHICGTPVFTVDVTLSMALQIGGPLGVSPGRATFSMGASFNVPSLGIFGANIGFFTSDVIENACGYLCNRNNLLTNIASCFWTGPSAQAAHGGTATIFEI